MDKTTLFFLIDKYLNGTATTQEKALLKEYYGRLEKTGTSKLSPQEKVVLKEEMYQNILRDISKGSKIIPLYKRSIFKRVAAAASIILVLSTGAYFYFNSRTEKEIAKSEIQVKDVEAPKVSKAMITLTNGKIVSLDSITSGTLATQGNVNVVKTSDGKIIYNGSSEEIAYNTLYNPRGSQVVNITLSDGSVVWLNAGSSLTYPVAFVGNERKVTIAGEAYFEVAHDATKPFIVSKSETSVQVLGTHFNVNSYDDESAIKVTLLEGSVKINNSVIIKPGQQAVVANEIKVLSGVDLEQVMAWKNGQFVLKGTDVAALLRQIARWYNVDIIFTGKVPERRFGGSISREVNLSAMLQALNENGVGCKLHEGKIIVK